MKDTFSELYEVVMSRKNEAQEGSYTCYLFESPAKIGGILVAKCCGDLGDGASSIFKQFFGVFYAADISVLNRADRGILTKKAAEVCGADVTHFGKL